MEIPPPIIKIKRNNLWVLFAFILIFILSFTSGISLSGRFVTINSEECQTKLKDVQESYETLLKNFARVKCCTKTLYGIGYDYKYYYIGFGDVICTNAKTSFLVNCPV